MKGPLKPEEITNSDLILSANSALHCLIHPNMREIAMEYIKKDKTINMFVFFDNPPTDSQIDDIGNVIVEMSCQFTNDVQFVEHISVVSYPNKISSKGICVFRRYEPLLAKKHGDFMPPFPNLEDRLDLILCAHRALLCEIRPNMRKVSVEYIKNQKKFVLYLYYDKSQSQEELDYDVAGTIIAEISSNFPNSIGVIWEDEVIVLPYPARMPDKGVCVFRRYEPSPPDEQNG